MLMLPNRGRCSQTRLLSAQSFPSKMSDSVPHNTLRGKDTFELRGSWEEEYHVVHEVSRGKGTTAPRPAGQVYLCHGQDGRPRLRVHNGQLAGLSSLEGHE